MRAEGYLQGSEISMEVQGHLVRPSGDGVMGDVDWRIRNVSTQDLGRINILDNEEAVVEAFLTKPKHTHKK